MALFWNAQRKRRYRSKRTEEKCNEIKEKEEERRTTLADELKNIIHIKERKWIQRHREKKKRLKVKIGQPAFKCRHAKEKTIKNFNKNFSKHESKKSKNKAHCDKL